MPFRDNDEATRARAEALAEKVLELEKERDELLHEKQVHDAEDAKRAREKLPEPLVEKPAEPAEKSAAKSAEILIPAKTDSFAKKYGWYLLVPAFMGAVALSALWRDRARAEQLRVWQAQVNAHDDIDVQWNGSIAIEPCVRSVQFYASSTRMIAKKEINARSIELTNDSELQWIEARCVDSIKALVASPSTPIPAKNALQKWITTEAALVPIVNKISTYYRARDFKEDNYASAPAMWQSLLDAMDARQAALVDVRATVFPILREVIVARQNAEASMNQHSDLWWRVELGLGLWEIEEVAYRVSGLAAYADYDGDPINRAVHDRLQALLGVSKDAPIEVRRALRKLDYIFTPVLAGKPGSFAFESLAREDFLAYLKKTPGAVPSPKRPPR